MAVFVDTGAWFAYFVRRDFAYFVRRDPDHQAAVAWMQQNRQPLVTSDLILDELLTLLKMRESHRVAAAAGDVLFSQQAARLERISPEDIAKSWGSSGNSTTRDGVSPTAQAKS